MPSWTPVSPSPNWEATCLSLGNRGAQVKEDGWKGPELPQLNSVGGLWSVYIILGVGWEEGLEK